MDLPTLMNSAELTDEQKVQLAQMMQSLNGGGGLNIGNPSMGSKKSKQRVSAQERNDLLNQLLNIGKLGTGTGAGTGTGVSEQPTIDELKKRMKTKRYQSQMLRTNTYGLKQKQLNQTKNTPKTQVQAPVSVPVPVPVSNPIDQDNTVTSTQTEPVNTTIESKETDVLAMGEALSKIISSDNTNTNEGENEDFDDFIV